jgi:hypothetical protein
MLIRAAKGVAETTGAKWAVKGALGRLHSYIFVSSSRGFHRSADCAQSTCQPASPADALLVALMVLPRRRPLEIGG